MGSRTARNSEKETISGKNGVRERKTGAHARGGGGTARRCGPRMTFESSGTATVERKTGWGKTNLRVARMTFQRCGRLEQLLTEYCNHYVSICRAVRISANRARPPAAFKKMIGRGIGRGTGGVDQPPRRRRSKIIRGTPPIKPFPRET